MKNSIIIDFDSTFVKVEGLEELAAIALKERENRTEILQRLQEITNLGMEGKLNFRESLQKRLALFSPQQKDITELVDLIKHNITTSIETARDFIRKNADNIYIISGGFEEWITPIVEPFGISKDHILCNSFVFNEKNEIIGFDETNPLSDSRGKVEMVKRLNLKTGVIVVGDGYTDYEIKKSGIGDLFIAFIENVERLSVVDKASKVAKDFNEVIQFIKEYEK